MRIKNLILGLAAPAVILGTVVPATAAFAATSGTSYGAPGGSYGSHNDACRQAESSLSYAERQENTIQQEINRLERGGWRDQGQVRALEGQLRNVEGTVARDQSIVRYDCAPVYIAPVRVGPDFRK